MPIRKIEIISLSSRIVSPSLSTMEVLLEARIVGCPSGRQWHGPFSGHFTVDYICVWHLCLGWRFKLRLPQGKEAKPFYWTYTNNARVVHSSQFPVKSQPGAFLGFDGSEIRVILWKKNCSTKDLRFILFLVWCPRRASGGGRSLLWDSCLVHRTLSDRWRPRGSCHTISSHESMGRRRQLFQQEYLHWC